MSKRKLIMDVDTGTDDAIAIMAALLSGEFDLLGVTTVAGNLPLKNTTANTLRVVSFIDPSVPVIRGCADPLVRDLDPRRKFCDNEDVIIEENGEKIAFHVEEFDALPESRIQPQDINAVSWLIDTLMHSEEKITLVLVGPQTNLATALRAEPRIVEHIEQMVIMGGGFEERNSSASAEFNFFMDPEAAQIVLSCGADIVLVPLDATHHAVLSDEDVREMRSWHSVIGDFVADITEERIKAYNMFQPLFKANSASMHDALCILYLLDPSVITESSRHRVSVQFGGGVSDGRTVLSAPQAGAAGDCLVCFKVDDVKFSSMLLSLLKRGNTL